MNAKLVYIILFRGVGGATQLPTAPLRAALTAAGFENVATYINSGNAVVRSGLPRDKTIAEIAELCSRDFGFDKAIYALTLDEWSDLIANNPFPEAVATPTFLHAAILAATPADANVEALRAVASGGEAIVVVGKVAYLHTPNGFGKSKFADRFDKGIGVPNTARNWNTVVKLHAIARTAAG